MVAAGVVVDAEGVPAGGGHHRLAGVVAGGHQGDRPPHVLPRPLGQVRHRGHDRGHEHGGHRQRHPPGPHEAQGGQHGQPGRRGEQVPVDVDGADYLGGGDRHHGQHGPAPGHHPGPARREGTRDDRGDGDREQHEVPAGPRTEELGRHGQAGVTDPLRPRRAHPVGHRHPHQAQRRQGGQRRHPHQRHGPPAPQHEGGDREGGRHQQGEPVGQAGGGRRRPVEPQGPALQPPREAQRAGGGGQQGQHVAPGLPGVGHDEGVGGQDQPGHHAGRRRPGEPGHGPGEHGDRRHPGHQGEQAQAGLVGPERGHQQPQVHDRVVRRVVRGRGVGQVRDRPLAGDDRLGQPPQREGGHLGREQLVVPEPVAAGDEPAAQHGEHQGRERPAAPHL
jgi:hypothetical protein